MNTPASCGDGASALPPGFRAALSTAALLLAAGPQRDDRAVRLSIHEQGVLDRPVVDKTGLSEKYDPAYRGHRRHSPASVTARRIEFRRPPTPDRNLFAAVQQQLGLRLDANRGAVEVLVIDKVEQPSEN